MVPNMMWWSRWVLALWAIFFWVRPAAAVYGGDDSWDYLVDRLVADGLDPYRVRAVFDDPRMPVFSGLDFQLAPRESRGLYRGFLSADSVGRARACRMAHDREFRVASARSGVPASVLAAIMHVETQCGRNTGREMVLFRLARLAMANEPRNLARNIARHTLDAQGAEAADIASQAQARARYLEQLFYPEVVATFRMAERLGIDPLAIRGSGAGAFGLTQFLPSSYLKFGTDGNGDERVSLYDPADAIASTANYLRNHGWRRGANRSERRQAIWYYNRSDAYIDTVLALADRLDGTARRPAAGARMARR